MSIFDKRVRNNNSNKNTQGSISKSKFATNIAEEKGVHLSQMWFMVHELIYLAIYHAQFSNNSGY